MATTTSFNTRYNRKKEIPVVNDQPSKTVPDQALSVKEILQRYAQGRPLHIDNSSRLTYTGDEYAPDVRTMDLVDIDRLKADTQEEINRLNNELNKPPLPPKESETRVAEKNADEGNEDKGA